MAFPEGTFVVITTTITETDCYLFNQIEPGKYHHLLTFSHNENVDEHGSENGTFYIVNDHGAK
jgi:hypothetical protein